MIRKLSGIGCLAMLSAVFVVYGQTAGPPAQSANSGADLTAAQRALVTQYCFTCHGEKAKAAGMDSALKLNIEKLDIGHVEKNPEEWERIVRKLRAGMMPPLNMRRPDPATFNGFITW